MLAELEYHTLVVDEEVMFWSSSVVAARVTGLDDARILEDLADVYRLLGIL